MAELKISKASQDDIVIWKNLQRYPAWRRVLSELQIKVEEADRIINTIGFDRDKMFSERDIAIIQKNAYLDLIQMPDKMIGMLQGTGTERTEELDPYEEELEDDDL